jgi:probable rRNA maturation factor
MSVRPRSPGVPSLVIDVATESALWQRAGAEAIVRGAIAAAAADIADAVELSIVLTDDARIRALNARWRHHDSATNVLSFPTAAGSHENARRHLGDIVIAYETTAREAAQEQKPFAHHLAHLAVHGFLHLLGYDHESDEDAEAMEQLERTILSRLDLPDPYVMRDAGTSFDA